jgi:hypothetical protein
VSFGNIKRFFRHSLRYPTLGLDVRRDVGYDLSIEKEANMEYLQDRRETAQTYRELKRRHHYEEAYDLADQFAERHEFTEEEALNELNR